MHNFSALNRRDILKLGIAGAIGAALPIIGAKDAYASNGGSWGISLHHAHTGEKYSGVYRIGDRYLPAAFEESSYVMRDFRTREVFPMDPHAIDIISMVQKKIDPRQPLEILSGYRSPKTNNMLRNASTGVAKNSFHMYGQAVDIRMPGYKTSYLRNVARSLRAGGVGYYPKSNFVHVDTGNVRSW